MRPGSTPWNQPPLAVLLAAFLFPPLGLLLVWKRPGTRLLRKLVFTVLICGLAIVHLALFWGLRIKFDGTGIRPMFVFENREAHYQEIEQDRAAARPIIPAPSVPEPAAEAPEPAGTEPPVPSPSPPPVNAYWTDFRGPNRDGVYRETAILTDWPPGGLQELWRKPIGEGFGSFVIAGGKAFTLDRRRDQEFAAAYDLETGRELWSNSWTTKFEDFQGGPGPRTTPTWNEGRLYALGVEGELRCLDADTGRVLWRKNILEDNGAENTQWGIAGSPLVVDDKVIVQPGGRHGSSVVAYEKTTGAPVWRALDDEQAYTSPMLATLAGRRQIIVVTAERVTALTVEDGKLLWSYPWTTSYNVNASQPLVAGDNRLYVSAGYGHGAALLEISDDGGQFGVKPLWQSIRMKNKFNGAVIHEGYVYGLDEGILACIDLATGDLKWKGGRYGYGQVLLAGDHLVILTERGELVLVKADPREHEELASFEALSGRTWNNPAIAAGKLLVRNETEMACYRIGD